MVAAEAVAELEAAAAAEQLVVRAVCGTGAAGYFNWAHIQ